MYPSLSDLRCLQKSSSIFIASSTLLNTAYDDFIWLKNHSNKNNCTIEKLRAVPVVLYRQIELLQVLPDQNLVYLDNRTLHIPFRLVLIGDLLREFDNFHFLESTQIQLFKDSFLIGCHRLSK